MLDQIVSSTGGTKMNKKLIIGLGIGCVLFCIGFTIVVAIASGVFFMWGMQEPENVNISVDSPIQVTKGESVIIKVQVENFAAESQILHSIDISNSYLDGIAIKNALPPFVESYPIPYIDMESYTFEQEISSRTTLVVQFFGVAVKTGDYSGEIDVCINTESVCTTFLIRTIVEE
jgi:hypothetical protein